MRQFLEGLARSSQSLRRVVLVGFGFVVGRREQKEQREDTMVTLTLKACYYGRRSWKY